MSQKTDAIAAYDAAHAAAVATQAAIATAVSNFLAAMSTAIGNHNAANTAVRIAAANVGSAGAPVPTPSVALAAFGDTQTGVALDAYHRIAGAAPKSLNLVTSAGV